MTSQLLILGNGFDLQCGLKSSYKDFFRQAILYAITERFGLAQMKYGVAGFWENLLYEYYKKYDNDDYKWCDIESIIKNTLWDMGLGKKNTDGIVKNILDCVNNKCFPNYDSTKDSIELFLSKYCFNFFIKLSPRHKVCSDQEKVRLLIERLLLELNNFERRFCKYIKNNIVNQKNGEEINEGYIINAVNLLAKLTGFSNNVFKSINNIIREERRYYEEEHQRATVAGFKNINVLKEEFTKVKNIHILSFNYTALFDILGVPSPWVYSNVHGKLCNELCSENCLSSSIIFGIDDKLIQSQSEYNDLRVFSKTYRKMFNTSSPESVLPNNDETVDIKFYGHSLSEADYSYFQSIFDYYNLYGNSSVSLYFYYSENYDPTDAVYRLINEYGKTLTNKDQGKNLMHKLLLENRINIQKI
ncbi:MAG: hypothetical protein J1F68_02660 [Clostridiales bacterium]|nr:hypothetical protein [Clostridiales bacterium]